LPKWRNFAQSGHTICSNTTRFVGFFACPKVRRFKSQINYFSSSFHGSAIASCFSIPFKLLSIDRSDMGCKQGEQIRRLFTLGFFGKYRSIPNFGYFFPR
jgi:hypothetical protein